MSAGKSAQKHTYTLSDGTDLEEYRENHMWDFSKDYRSKKRLTPEDVSLIASCMPKTLCRCLHLVHCGITDIGALKNMMNDGMNLDLRGNKIADISALKGSNFHQLDLIGNEIVDISALKGSNIRMLFLAHNQIADISALNGSSIWICDLSRNQITDISDLIDLIGSLPDIWRLTVTNNQITEDDKLLLRRASFRKPGTIINV